MVAIERMFTTAELAQETGISERTWRNWRERGTGPKAVVLGRSVRYPASAVHEWLAESESSNAA